MHNYLKWDIFLSYFKKQCYFQRTPSKIFRELEWKLYFSSPEHFWNYSPESRVQSSNQTGRVTKIHKLMPIYMTINKFAHLACKTQAYRFRIHPSALFMYLPRGGCAQRRRTKNAPPAARAHKRSLFRCLPENGKVLGAREQLISILYARCRWHRANLIDVSLSSLRVDISLNNFSLFHSAFELGATGFLSLRMIAPLPPYAVDKSAPKDQWYNFNCAINFTFTAYGRVWSLFLAVCAILAPEVIKVDVRMGKDFIYGTIVVVSAEKSSWGINLKHLLMLSWKIGVFLVRFIISAVPSHIIE